ncbi:MAG: hypothetical protein A2Z20_06805 [Bdellovibrionales bacterium RBG_16_40_8]|nr:MAG: hypothetical protein A2Z20_06805 [Bdellovibrionales bacterium RBG_16_40_8]
MNAKIIIVIATSALVLSGCSGDGGSSNASEAFSNISGTVAQSVGSQSFFSKISQKLGIQSKIKSLDVEDNCQIDAADIDTGEVISSTTSDSDGHYTLSGVDAGVTYKIIATCGANMYSSVATAVVSDPSTLDESERVATNPRSTLIAAYILQAIVNAVDQATQNVGGNQELANAIKAAIFSALDSVIQTITSTINEAIESGAMQEPDITSATAIAGDLDGAIDSSDISDVVDAIDAPASVTQSVVGATQNSAASQACNEVQGGTLAACTASVARLMYNVLGFPVALKTSSGVFDLSGCSSSDTINGGSETIEEAFPNSLVIDGASDPVYPDTLCIVKPNLGEPDRNRGYENGGDHGGPMFSETADMDDDASDDVGVLSAMGTALFNSYKYRLSHINRLVFDYQNGAGMNVRLINQRFVLNNNGGQGQVAHYYYNGASWSNTLWPANCGYDNSQICKLWDINFNFADATWRTAQNEILLAAAIGTSQLNLNVMSKKFSGPVPSQSQIDSFVDDGRVHTNHNITGEKEFSIVTTKPAGFDSAGANPCWDKDPSTPCLDPGGSAVVPVLVNLTFGSVDAKGFKPITSITSNISGAYYLWPMFGMKGFSGVLGFIKVSDGKIVQDELFRQRAVKIILNSSECAQNGLDDGSCAQSKIYNVELDWSQCNGNGGDCPAYAENGADVAVTGYSANVQSDYRTTWENFCDTNNCMGHQLVGSGDWGDMETFKFSVTSQADSDAISLAGTGKASSEGEYNLAIKNDCTATGCTFGGFYLVDNTGAMHVDADINCASCSAANFWGGTNIGIYTLAYINTGNDFDSNTGGSQGLQTVAANHWIFNAPIVNPNFACAGEPFFIDGNNNGKLDCGLVGGVSRAINGDVSFSGEWEYNWYISDPGLDGATASARAANPLREVDNAFAFRNPVGTKKLLATAFNGWFDGKHSISSTTDFNALQVFALVYLFFEDGDEYKYIDDIISGQNRFSIESPAFDDNEEMITINKAIGQAMLDFKAP